MPLFLFMRKEKAAQKEKQNKIEREMQQSISRFLKVPFDYSSGLSAMLISMGSLQLGQMSPSGLSSISSSK